jgi:hypothetical protein
LKLDLRLSIGGQQDFSEGPGRNSDARLFLRELSDSVSQASLRDELRSLERERDSELLGASLRSLAHRQESRGNADVAAAIYQLLANSPQTYGEADARLSRERLEVLRGHGSFGARFELFSQNFVHEVTNPAGLAGMALAGAVFQGVRLASYARLLGSASANPLTRGLGARGLSWGLGLLAEGPAFTLGIRSTNAMLGHSQDWSGTALAHELGASYLTMGALRLSGIGGDLLFRRFGSANGLLSRGLFHQASMLTGITTAHWLEQRVGLRERSDGATLLATSLASLLHFNVAGRLLHSLPGSQFTQRLRFHQENLQNLPPPSFEGARPLMAPWRAPLLAGADTVFMSGINSPSDRPLPGSGTIAAEPRRSSRPSTQPPPNGEPAANLREITKSLNDTLTDLDNNSNPGWSWIPGCLEPIRLYADAVDWLRYQARMTGNPPEEVVYNLRDLAAESATIERLLGEAGNGGNQAHLSSQEHWVGQFFVNFYRSSNTLNNVLNNNATLPEPLRHLRSARFWLQYGVERGNQAEAAELPADFPYQRGEDGFYEVRGTNTSESGEPTVSKRIIIVGDERAQRTFRLMAEGHKVVFVESDDFKLRNTQRLLDMKVGKARDSGEWRLSLPAGVERPDYLRSLEEPTERADILEAFFPDTLFENLRARSDPGRMLQLRKMINDLAVKVNDGGSAFVLSHRHDVIEDLARAVLRHPTELQLLELRQAQDWRPLRAGMDVTAVDGENIYSWLIFRKLSSTTPGSEAADQSAP